MPLPGVFNQVRYPEAEDIDDCWVVATVWAALASRPSARKPTVTEFRAAAGDPDDGNADGGSESEVYRGARGIWPDIPVTAYHGEWAPLAKLIKSGRIASAAVLSSRLPINYGFLGWHQVGVAWDGGYVVANPLAPEGSAPTAIGEAALRSAVMPLGYARALLFPVPEVDVPFPLTVIDDERRGVLRFARDTKAYGSDGRETVIPKGSIWHAHGLYRAESLNGSGYLIGNPGGSLLFVGLSVAPALDTGTWPDGRPYTVELTVGGKKVTTGPLTLP